MIYDKAFMVSKLVFFSNVDKERNTVSNCCFNINLEFKKKHFFSIDLLNALYLT